MMDNSIIFRHIALDPFSLDMSASQKRDGFQGQVQYVIPPPILSAATGHLLVNGLFVTDAGYYPQAKHHYRERPEGADQNILIICTEGSGWVEMNGERTIIRANHALLIPRKKPHIYAASRRDPWSIEWVHFLGEDAPYYFSLLRQNCTVRVDPELRRRIDRFFLDVFDVLARGFTQETIICAAQVVRGILGWLFFNNKAFSLSNRANRLHSLDQVVEFMEQHLGERLSVSQIAQAADLSCSHVSRLFTQERGLPPLDYFIHLKMQRACRFLTLTPLSVKEIAARLGYSDQYYFSRTFRKVIGACPTSYRQARVG